MHFSLIESRSGVLGGKPVFIGTRIPITLIFELLASGRSEQRICKEYPGLTTKHIEEALVYAKYLVGNEDVFYA